MHYSGHVGNTPFSFGHESNDAARVSNDGRVAMRSVEGKAAKTFIEKINAFAFSEEMFAQMVISHAGNSLAPRVIKIVKALIRNYALHYDVGIVNNETIEAKRLNDVMDRYGM